MKDFESTLYGRPNTVKTYRSLYRKHLQFREPQPDWANWSEESTHLLLREWEEKGLSRNTQLALLRLLARYVKFMGGPAIDTRRFARVLERGKQQTEVTALSRDEADKLIEACQRLEPKFYPVMMLALHAGLRRGEIFGLRCEDVDMLAGKIKVSHSYDGPTKNGKSRIVPMTAKVSNALSSARNLMLRDPQSRVFELFDPGPILRRLCHCTRLPVIRFHDLRHTFASLALSSGVSPKQVSAWLGHSSVATTLNVYWHLTSEEADLSFLE